MSIGRNTKILSIVVLLLVPCVATAAKRGQKAQAAPDAQAVEMFAAIQDGQIDVQLIPKDSTVCKVLVKNKTDRPLSVKLPEAFAGVPVLAQQPVGAVGRAARGAANDPMQAFGGGMGGMGMGGMGMGGMGMGMMNVAPEKVPAMNLMNVAPEKVGQTTVTTVCLEHGKAEPKPHIKYQIKPIEQFSDKPAVAELCRMLGTGQVPQRAAQVAAWHLNNNMSWQQLTAKELRFADGTSRPYFNAAEIQQGMQLVVQAQQLAAERASQQKSAPSSNVSASTASAARQ